MDLTYLLRTESKQPSLRANAPSASPPSSPSSSTQPGSKPNQPIPVLSNGHHSAPGPGRAEDSEDNTQSRARGSTTHLMTLGLEDLEANPTFTVWTAADQEAANHEGNFLFHIIINSSNQIQKIKN